MTKEQLFKENPQIKGVYSFFQKKRPDYAEEYLENMIKKYSSEEVLPQKKLTLEEICICSRNKGRKDRSFNSTKERGQINRHPRQILLEHPETKEVKNLSQWAKTIGVTRQTMQTRYKKHGNVPEIYQKPIVFYNENPDPKQVRSLAQTLKLGYNTVKYRLIKYGSPDNWPSTFFPKDF